MNSLKARSDVEQKCGTIEQACSRYSLGAHTMRDTAEAAGAVIRIGKRYLVNFSKVDAYLDSISE